jgi:hypothetical protein
MVNFRVHHGFDHKSNIVSLKLLAVHWQSLLAPTEFDNFQFLALLKLFHDFPKEFNSFILLSQALQHT